MKKVTYKQSGVDIDAANEMVRRIKPLAAGTKIPGSLGNIGAFGGFFKIDFSAYKDPVLVSSTDGVGTKLLVAKALRKHDTIGIDLVAMNVNDVLACGARPYFFLDYFACGKLEPGVMYDVLKGIAKGCRMAGCALIGGETAELPGMYAKGTYDLAGFCVGAVERRKIVDGSKIKAGDIVLGIESSGLHSNGFSLARRALSANLIRRYGALLLKPTIIYVKAVLDILKNLEVRGIAHITGGGFYDNIARFLPKGASCLIYKDTWPVHEIFRIIQKKGIPEREMHRVFNMGIGMALIMPASGAKKAQGILKAKHKLKSWVIGTVVKGNRQVRVI